jgi:hypothetical protein
LALILVTSVDLGDRFETSRRLARGNPRRRGDGFDPNVSVYGVKIEEGIEASRQKVHGPYRRSRKGPGASYLPGTFQKGGCDSCIIDVDPYPAAIGHLYTLTGRLLDSLRHCVADTWLDRSRLRATRQLG